MGFTTFVAGCRVLPPETFAAGYNPTLTGEYSSAAIKCGICGILKTAEKKCVMNVDEGEVSLHELSNRRKRIAEQRACSHLESLYQNNICSDDESDKVHLPCGYNSMQPLKIRRSVQKLVYDSSDSMQNDVGAAEEKIKTQQKFRKLVNEKRVWIRK